MRVKLTPMLKQYLSIKERYPDALLFFRMGDFYELFFEDAEIASRELQIALTSRNPHDEHPVPMCGVPHHAAEDYLKQLLEKNYKIAICDQVEDPKKAKGLVKREVVRVLTPGTAVESVVLNTKANNYLASFCYNGSLEIGALSWLDYSTGEWMAYLVREKGEIWKWLAKVSPSEILCREGEKIPGEYWEFESKVTYLSSVFFDLNRALRLLRESNLAEELLVENTPKNRPLIQCCGALLLYLTRTHNQNFSHLSPVRVLNLNKFLIIDEITERNLELFKRLDGGKGSGTLISLLDFTSTPMGARYLSQRLKYPYRDKKKIYYNLEVVEFLHNNPEVMEEVKKLLSRVSDLERLINRIFLNRGGPKDFAALRSSISPLPDIPPLFSSKKDYPPGIQRILSSWDPLEDLYSLLLSSLVDTPPALITEGGIFKEGYNKELDELIEMSEHGEKRLKDLLKKEQERTNISRLKLGFNRVFGYYFEVPKSFKGDVPDYFIRRQTLVNSERYITEELKELEEKIFSSEEKRKQLEYDLFVTLRKKVLEFKKRILDMARLIARLDFYCALAICARRYRWNKPIIHEGLEIEIIQGRHPVVEQMQGRSSYIPNDITVGEKHKILLITGPNMAGKSTVLRQVALICILAQMGSFVPAEKAKIGLCDRIFTRVGASDNLARGQSTFMVEMLETARILKNSTKRSLVVLDEIGRGTSTFDGLAIAWAVVEFLAKKAEGIRTLFATHYHELTELEKRIKGVTNFNIAVKEWKGEIIFLRKLLPGPADKSYGIEVAKLAGLPKVVIGRAKEILTNLEDKMEKIKRKNGMKKRNIFLPQMDLLPSEPPVSSRRHHPHPLMEELKKLNIDKTTPLDALNILAKWKEKWCEKQTDT